MKGIKLITLVLSILCAIHVDGNAQIDNVHTAVTKVSTLEIAPLPLKTSPQLLQSKNSITKRRKISSTLRKPICKKWKSKNWNLC